VPCPGRDGAIRQALNWLFPTRPSFVVTGTGRCGTAYAAARLTRLGLACTHEAYFTPRGPRLRSTTRPRSALGDSSWLAAPYLDDSGSRVVHLVRRPLDVILSLYNIGFFDPALRPIHAPFIAFAERYFDPGPDPLDACIRWYLDWNRRCERTAGLRIRIEDFEAELPRLLGFLGQDGIDPARAPPLPAAVNRRPAAIAEPLSRDALRQRLGDHPRRTELAEMGQAYGYGAEL